MDAFKKTVNDLRENYINFSCKDKDTALKMAIDSAEKILKAFPDKAFPFKIGKALKILGFSVFIKKFSDKNLSGILAINANDGTKLAATVNKIDSHEHQIFSLAHELAHYIFDVRNLEKKTFVANYRTDNENENSISEFRANKFAANLLMPENEFLKKYDDFSKELKTIEFKTALLSNYFGVSYTAVFKRLKELGVTK